MTVPVGRVAALETRAVNAVAIKFKPKVKRLRRHADAPANWQWRPQRDGGGKPRWIPSPTLRKAGWKGLDLKDDDGVFLTEGLSRDRAREINAAVKAWKRGEAVPAAFADIAPTGAVEAAPEPQPEPNDRLAIGRLVDAYVESREVKGQLDAKGVLRPGLSENTQAANRQGLKRLIDALAGFAALPDKSDPEQMARYAAAVATVRAASISILEPVETEGGMARLLYDAYWALHAHAGPSQAYRVMAAASGWLRWCWRNQSRSIRQEWVTDVDRETPDGRIRAYTVEEFRVMVATADRMGWLSIGDSIVLGLDLSWSQVDRLKLTWSRLIDFRAFTGSAGRTKTGRVGGTPLTSIGRARVEQIMARQATMDPKPTHLIWCETTGRPWHARSYGARFAEIRAEAAKTCPTLLDDAETGHKGVWDADLRDTAFTWMKAAGLSDDGIASRTIQSRKHIAQLGDGHYGEIGPEIADPAAQAYDAYLQRIGAGA